MGFQFVVMFIGSFMDDVTYVRDVEICMLPGFICYGSDNFGMGSLHNTYGGLARATPQFYSVAPNRFDYRLLD